MNLFLDVDGPLANFHAAYLLQPSINRPDLWENWPAGSYDIPDVLGITKDQFWSHVKPGFFANLDLMEDAFKIVATVARFDPNFEICTSPGPHYYAPSEKCFWLRHHFGSGILNRVTITSNKHKGARYDNVLIDDHPGNVLDYKRNGGNAILLPRKWNSRHAAAHDAVKILELELEFLSTRIPCPQRLYPPRIPQSPPSHVQSGEGCN